MASSSSAPENKKNNNNGKQSSVSPKRLEQIQNAPRSNLAHDLHAAFAFTSHAMLNPMELVTGCFPSLNELTCGLLGWSFRPQRDIPDLTGKVVFVTGGSKGLGKETIRQLAQHKPARIYLGSRSKSSAVEAIKSIKREISALSSSSSSTVDIQFIQLDLTDFSSIKQAAETIIQNNTRLDILVLNAGVLAEPAVTTPQGHEIQLGTNHIGHFMLTKLLLPLLLKTANPPDSNTPKTTVTPPADVRVVTISSVASGLTPSAKTNTPTDLMNTISSTSKLVALTTWQRYAVSKAANILFANELARRYPSITSVSVHPGVVASDLYSNTAATNSLAASTLPSLMLLFRSVPSGTLNQLWAAAGASKDDLVNGAFYTPVGHINKRNRFVSDKILAKKLWEWTDEEVTKAGY